MPAATRLSEAIDEYLAVLLTQAKPTTIRARKSALLRFLAAAGNIYPKNLGPQHVDAFLIKHKHWDTSTRKTNIAYLSGFQRWLQARKYMDRGTDLLEGRRRIKLPKKRKVFIKPEDFDRALDACTSGRDRVTMALGLYLLVRESEMVTIQWKHVDLAEGFVGVYRSKTEEWEDLPISAKLHVELSRWRAEVGEVDPEWYVVCAMRRAAQRGSRGRFLSEMQLVPERALAHPLRRIKMALETIGYQGAGVGMHTLRRSGAAALLGVLEQGSHDESAIRVIQSMLGHESISTTEIYLNRDVDRARRDDLIRGKMLYGEDLNLELEMLDGASADARV